MCNKLHAVTTIAEINESKKTRGLQYKLHRKYKLALMTSANRPSQLTIPYKNELSLVLFCKKQELS